MFFWGLYGLRMAYEAVFNSAELVFPTYYYIAYAFGICIGPTLGFLQPMSLRVKQLAPWFLWGLALTANLAGLLFRRGAMMISERLYVTELLNPISYGQCAVTLILLATFLALHTRGLVRLLLLAASVVPGFFVLALSASRSPVLSLGAGMCLLAYNGIRNGANWRVMLGLVSGVIVAVIGFRVLLASESMLTSRVQDTYEDLKFGGEIDRFMLWNEALHQYRTSPVVGVGLEIRGSGYPHNLTVESLLTLGVVGCVLFLWLQFSTLRDSFRLLRTVDSAWLPLLAIQFLMLSMFSGGLYCSPEFWGIVMLQAATAKAERMGGRERSQNRGGLVALRWGGKAPLPRKGSSGFQ